MRRAGPLAAALALILAVGWIDYITGPQVGLSLLYIAPVAAVAWLVGGPEAIACAIVAAVCWFFADFLWAKTSITISLWNSFTRLILYGGVAFLVRRVRVDRDALIGVNVQLQDAVRRESSLARTDQLTGLPNSRAFLEYLLRENARASRERSTLCVLYLDLDNFKRVNDLYGHDAGDAVLREAAQSISTSLRNGDVVARIGGDEFAVLLWHVALDEASHVIDRITRRIAVVAEHYPNAHLGVSIGIGYFDTPPADPEDAVRAADRAMYRSKQSRRQTGR